MIEVNKKELNREMEEIGCCDKLDSAVLEEWRNEIAIYGRRMFYN
jgi:hypothetical protein